MEELLIEAILPIASALGTVALGFVIRILRDKAKEIESRHIRELAFSALEESEVAAQKAVEAVQEGFVKDLKKTGEFDKEKGKEAMERASKVFLNSLSDSSMKILKEQTNNFDEWIREFLEAKLYEEKELGNITDPK